MGHTSTDVKPRVWEIYIPIRPKAVQSVRGGSKGFYADHGARKWKESIKPFIRASSPGRPTAMPLQVTKLCYLFRCPKSTSEQMRDYIVNGGTVPYIGNVDIMDNLAKGLVDTCAGIVFENDKQIWRTCHTEKLYHIKDGILIVFEETPSMIMIDGKRADGSMPDPEMLF